MINKWETAKKKALKLYSSEFSPSSRHEGRDRYRVAPHGTRGSQIWTQITALTVSPTRVRIMETRRSFCFIFWICSPKAKPECQRDSDKYSARLCICNQPALVSPANKLLIPVSDVFFFLFFLLLKGDFYHVVWISPIALKQKQILSGWTQMNRFESK